MILALLLFMLSGSFVFGVKLPSYFKKCDHSSPDFNNCIKLNMENSLELLSTKGDKSLKLPKISPMFIKEVNVVASPDLTILFKDVDFFGFQTTKFNSVNFDIDKLKLDLDFVLVNYGLDGSYIVDGKIMILPLKGDGHAIINTTNGKCEYNAKLEILQKGNQQYFNIKDYQFEFEPGFVYYKLDNLFNGDERLGTEMNIFLNENWPDVYVEVRQGYEYTISLLITKIINAFFEKIPISELYT